MGWSMALRMTRFGWVLQVLCPAPFLVESGTAGATAGATPFLATAERWEPLTRTSDFATAFSEAAIASSTAPPLSVRGSTPEAPAQATALAEDHVRISVPFRGEVAERVLADFVAKAVRQVVSAAPDETVEVVSVSSPESASWRVPSASGEEAWPPLREAVLELRVVRAEGPVLGSPTLLRLPHVLESQDFLAALHATLGPTSREVRVLSGQATSTTENVPSLASTTAALTTGAASVAEEADTEASTTAALTTGAASVAEEADTEEFFVMRALEWFLNLSILEQVLYTSGTFVSPCLLCLIIHYANHVRRQLWLKRRLSRVGTSPACQSTKFRFIKASCLREMTEPPVLCRHQDLPDDWFEDVIISPLDVLRKTKRRSCLAVSRRWENVRHPDPAGDQIEIVRRHLLECPHIEFVWIDYWCMPQGECTKQELAYAQEVVDRYAWLFLAVPVLIILDLEYLNQFWTCLEAFLAMHEPGDKAVDKTVKCGLVSAPSERKRKETGEEARYFIRTICSNFEERLGENPAMRHMSLRSSTNSVNSDEGESQPERVGRDIKASIRYLDGWRDRPLKRAVAILKRRDRDTADPAMKKRALNALKRLKGEIKEAFLELEATALHRSITKEELIAPTSRTSSSASGGFVAHHERKTSRVMTNTNSKVSTESKRSRRTSSDYMGPVAPLYPGDTSSANSQPSSMRSQGADSFDDPTTNGHAGKTDAHVDEGADSFDDPTTNGHAGKTDAHVDEAMIGSTVDTVASEMSPNTEFEWKAELSSITEKTSRTLGLSPSLDQLEHAAVESVAVVLEETVKQANHAVSEWPIPTMGSSIHTGSRIRAATGDMLPSEMTAELELNSVAASGPLAASQTSSAHSTKTVVKV